MGGGVRWGEPRWKAVSLRRSSSIERSITSCKSVLFKEVLSACLPGLEGVVINLSLPVHQEEFGT